MMLSDPTARTPLGRVDLVPFLDKDAGDDSGERRDWERRPAAIALARRGWTRDRIMRATGLTSADVAEVLDQHLPIPEPAPVPEPVPPAIEVRPLSRHALPIMIIDSGPKRAGRSHSVDWQTKERIDALSSMNSRKDDQIRHLQARLAEAEDSQKAVAAARRRHRPEQRYTDTTGESSYDTAADAAEAFGIPVTAVHYFLICAHCGDIEMGDEDGRDYRESLWPCATAKDLGLDSPLLELESPHV